jgi:hypothetical protein
MYKCVYIRGLGSGPGVVGEGMDAMGEEVRGRGEERPFNTHYHVSFTAFSNGSVVQSVQKP